MNAGTKARRTSQEDANTNIINPLSPPKKNPATQPPRPNPILHQHSNLLLPTDPPPQTRRPSIRIPPEFIDQTAKDPHGVRQNRMADINPRENSRHVRFVEAGEVEVEEAVDGSRGDQDCDYPAESYVEPEEEAGGDCS